MYVFVVGFSRSHVQLFSLTRPVCDEVHLPRFLHNRSFSQTAVCFASKESSPRDGDGGKVHFIIFVTLFYVNVCWKCKIFITTDGAILLFAEGRN